ncbi:MAG: HAMP domain-containing sensor histidine kinase, partial [Oscillospiraceae bacterium]|nr:HAMP domain-containing sensor histidine kinase [Oscillospiraceae bacterium]
SSFAQADYPCFILDDALAPIWCNEAAENLNLTKGYATHFVAMTLARSPWAAGLLANQLAVTLNLSDGALMGRNITLLPLPGQQYLVTVMAASNLPFIPAFSQNLRNDITDIFLLLPLLEKNIEDARELEYSERIYRNCYRMLRSAVNTSTLNQLIQNQPVKAQLIDLNLLAEKLCNGVNTICSPKSNIPLTFIKCEIPLFIEGDEKILATAILNVLQNAYIYTRDGNEIVLRLSATGGRAVLTVTDKGAGIKPENLLHIFDLYFSVLPYDDDCDRPGLGVGLALTKETICRMGGTVAVESRFGYGTSLTLAIPLALDSFFASPPAEYIMDKYSPLFVQMCDICCFPTR